MANTKLVNSIYYKVGYVNTATLVYWLLMNGAIIHIKYPRASKITIRQILFPNK